MKQQKYMTSYNTESKQQMENVAKKRNKKNGCCGCIVMILVIPMIIGLIAGMFGDSKTSDVENKNRVEQETFCKMLKDNDSKVHELGNVILEKEFCDSVKFAIAEYMDSIRLLINWKVRIKSIKSEDYEKGL